MATEIISGSIRAVPLITTGAVAAPAAFAVLEQCRRIVSKFAAVDGQAQA